LGRRDKMVIIFLFFLIEGPILSLSTRKMGHFSGLPANVATGQKKVYATSDNKRIIERRVWASGSPSYGHI